MSKLTPAQARALESVRGGRCYRKFTSEGNTVHSPNGDAASVLWKLERMGLIRETHHITTTRMAFSLTDEGRMALRQAEEQ